MKWEKMKIGDLLKVTSGGTPSRRKNENFDNGNIPWVKTGDLKPKYLFQSSEFITELGLKSSSAKLFPPNTVLIAMYGATIGACSILKIEAATNQACGALLPDEKLNENYLYYFLKSSKQALIRKGVGGAQPNISGGILKDTKIPLPPLPLQKKIAEILDTADALRRQTVAQLADLDKLAEAVFLEMFGDPVLNDKEWKKTSLGENLKFMTSGSRGWAKYYSEEGDVFLRINNVGKNRLLLDSIKFVNTPDNAEAKRTKVKAGDLLISMTADLGRTAVIPEGFPRAHINQHLGLLRLTDNLNPFYVSEFIASCGGKFQLKKLDKGGVKAGLNFTDVKSIRIPVPPLSLQNKFSEILENIESQKAALKQSLQESEDLFHGLLQEVFD